MEIVAGSLHFIIHHDAVNIIAISLGDYDDVGKATCMFISRLSVDIIRFEPPRWDDTRTAGRVVVFT